MTNEASDKEYQNCTEAHINFSLRAEEDLRKSDIISKVERI